jgi:hypothetical protein
MPNETRRDSEPTSRLTYQSPAGGATVIGATGQKVMCRFGEVAAVRLAALDDDAELRRPARLVGAPQRQGGSKKPRSPCQGRSR